MFSHTINDRFFGVTGSRSKKTGEFVTYCAAVLLSEKISNQTYGSPVAARQKGGQYVDIKRTEENCESS